MCWIAKLPALLVNADGQCPSNFGETAVHFEQPFFLPSSSTYSEAIAGSASAQAH